MRASFPPSARLHRPSEFASALKGKHLARGEYFVVSTPRGPLQEHAETPRLGLIVAKRFAPLAVTRNAIKRVIREAFRQRRHELPARDMVIRLQKRIGPVSLRALKAQVRQEIEAHFDRILR